MKGNLRMDLPSYQKLGVVERLPSSIVVHIDGRNRRLDSNYLKLPHLVLASSPHDDPINAV